MLQSDTNWLRKSGSSNNKSYFKSGAGEEILLWSNYRRRRSGYDCKSDFNDVENFELIMQFIGFYMGFRFGINNLIINKVKWHRSN